MRRLAVALALASTTTVFADWAETVSMTALEGPSLTVQLYPNKVILSKQGEPPAAVYPEIDGAALACAAGQVCADHDGDGDKSCITPPQ